MLEGDFDCLAVALPESFRASVLEAIQLLPTPSMVLQRSLPDYGKSWDDDSEDDSSSDSSVAWSYVPIDPCQPVIMGLRFAMEERLAVKFIDLETNEFQPQSTVLPDPYALKTVSLERFATAVLPSIMRPFIDQEKQRIRYMAWKLHQLEQQYDNIVLVCSIQKWPWLREAYAEFRGEPPEHDAVEPPTIYSVNPNSLLFMFGELPFITGLHEQARFIARQCRRVIERRISRTFGRAATQLAITLTCGARCWPQMHLLTCGTKED